MFRSVCLGAGSFLHAVGTGGNGALPGGALFPVSYTHLLNDGLVTSPADVLVLPMTEDLTAAISFATQLRQGGVRAQVYGEQKKRCV